MEDKIIFDDLDIEFTDEELEGVDIDTLNKCKQKLKDTIEKLMNK